MAKSFNQAIVMGNLTRDPELRTTPNGQSVASFAVATNRSWTDQSGQRRDEVEYHEIVAWGKLGELTSQYLSKGRKVMVVGRLQTRSWEKDGIKRQRTEIIASDINFLDRPQDAGDQFSAPAMGAAAPSSAAAVSESKQATEPVADAGKSEKTSSDKKQDKKSAGDVQIEDLDAEGDVNLDDIPF